MPPLIQISNWLNPRPIRKRNNKQYVIELAAFNCHPHQCW